MVATLVTAWENAEDFYC